jgi:hypothetical protein
MQVHSSRWIVPTSSSHCHSYCCVHSFFWSELSSGKIGENSCVGVSSCQDLQGTSLWLSEKIMINVILLTIYYFSEWDHIVADVKNNSCRGLFACVRFNNPQSVGTPKPIPSEPTDQRPPPPPSPGNGRFLINSANKQLLSATIAQSDPKPRVIGDDSWWEIVSSTSFCLACLILSHILSFISNGRSACSQASANIGDCAW